jgi:hypothetical protein
MKTTTFKTLLSSVFNEKDTRNLNQQLNHLYSTNHHNITYDDMLNLIQDTIFYNLQHDHKIEPGNFKMKFKFLFLSFMKRKKIINIESLDNIIDNNLNYKELTYEEL